MEGLSGSGKAGLRGAAVEAHSVRSHRPRYVLELLLAGIVKNHVQLVTDVPVRIFRNADAAGLSNRFKPRRYIHTIAEDILAFDQHVTQIDADAKQHAPILRHVSIPLDHELLHRHGTLDGRHDGWELHQQAVSRRLDNPAASTGQERINSRPVLAESLGRAGLIGAHQPAVSGDIGGQDGRKPAFDPVLPWSGHGPALSDYSTPARGRGGWPPPPKEAVGTARVYRPAGAVSSRWRCPVMGWPGRAQRL